MSKSRLESKTIPPKNYTLVRINLGTLENEKKFSIFLQQTVLFNHNANLSTSTSRCFIGSILHKDVKLPRATENEKV